MAETFADVSLGDKRRENRLRVCAEILGINRGETLPAKFGGGGDLFAFYRLMDCDEVTHDKLVQCSQTATYRRMAGREIVLLTSDTSTLDYSGLHVNGGLGPVGNGNGRGLLAHNTLAVTSERQSLGLANQILHKRRASSQKKSKAEIAADPHRESRLWRDAVADLPVAPEGCLVVDVCDRGADVTEFLAFERDAGRHFVVRSQQSRKVRFPVENTRSEADRPAYHERKLHGHIRSLTPAETGRRELEVPVRKGNRVVGERKAELAVAWTEVEIIPPRQPRGEHDQNPIRVWAVRVFEPDPPRGEKPVEWILLSNVPMHSIEDAWERVDWYACRWVVEELHKSMKTGLGVENLQLETRDRLDPAIALFTIVAELLLHLRDAARRPESARLFAVSLLPELWLDILQTALDNGRRRLDRRWTIRDFLHGLAKLGGYPDRKNDGPPGWLTIWRGWSQFHTLLNFTKNYLPQDL